VPSPQVLVFEISELPDFLSDHTLLSAEPAGRLQEHCARWVQLIGNLWKWHDRAAFCLRFISDPALGRVDVFLLARSSQTEDTARLSLDIEILLHGHDLPFAFPRDRDRALRVPAGTVTWEVRQRMDAELWRWQVTGDDGQRLPPPQLVYGWWGPGGPFLLPMEALVSQRAPTTLSVYLQPTRLEPAESDWLSDRAAVSAKEASSRGPRGMATEAQVKVDPTAQLASELYMANLRRLFRPFLVGVRCTASGADRGAADASARAVASSIEALVHEIPFHPMAPEGGDLPASAQARPLEADPQYAGIFFDRNALPEVVEVSRTTRGATGRWDISRLPYLVDADGAATVFRLPVSVRGGVPGIEVRQRPPDFHPGARSNALPSVDPGPVLAGLPGRRRRPVLLGRLERGGFAHVDADDLTRHTLVTGFTGSGKTRTILSLLDQLWIDHDIPFLVVESAKSEYRGLRSVRRFVEKAAHDPGKKLRIYTVGNEACCPLRFNPFELLPGIRLEAHIGRLLNCFEASLPPIGPLPSILIEALIRVYLEAGWGMLDVGPERTAPQARIRPFPTMAGFAAMAERVLAQRDYKGDVKDNLRAAINGRIKTLLIGSKGLLFGAERSEPPATALFGSPVVLEMNDLTLEDKALFSMFLLTALREYREIRRADHGELLHVTVVEEAHNVLENVGSSGSGEGQTHGDTRFKAVQAFCSLLTEIRSYGEGVIIADQSPEKLAPDAIRNTNLQIAHQLRDSRDREAVARAMIMDTEQRDFLGKLLPGRAALFMSGLQRATFIVVPEYGRADGAGGADARGAGYAMAPDPIEDERAVRRYMMEAHYAEVARRLYPSCRWCRRPECDHRDRMWPRPEQTELDRRFDEVMLRMYKPPSLTEEELGLIWLEFARIALDGAAEAGVAGDLEAGWCFATLRAHRWLREMMTKYDPMGAWNWDGGKRRRFERAWAAAEGR
jgi:hypothetical protein